MADLKPWWISIQALNNNLWSGHFVWLKLWLFFTGYSSFGLGASYNSLLSNGYASSAYSPYGGQTGYGCLNYANAFPTGDTTGFGISSALAGAASGRWELLNFILVILQVVTILKQYTQSSLCNLSMYNESLLHCYQWVELFQCM